MGCPEAPTTLRIHWPSVICARFSITDNSSDIQTELNCLFLPEELPTQYLLQCPGKLLGNALTKRLHYDIYIYHCGLISTTLEAETLPEQSMSNLSCNMIFKLSMQVALSVLQ